MKKFEVTFIKVDPIATMGKKAMQLARQIYITDQETIKVSIPAGYTCFQIIEYLPDVMQDKP